jgi:transcriptional regulator of heat shock response
VNKIVRYLACFVILVTADVPVVAQTAATPQQTQEANLKEYVSLLRTDLKKGKVSILTELMALGPDQAAKFWPIYNEYDKALTKLADERIAFIRMYADNYSSLSDENATKIATGMMDVQARRLDLQKQYFQRFSQTLTPKDAARWLQIEAQIEKLVDLQILASLPIVQ